MRVVKLFIVNIVLFFIFLVLFCLIPGFLRFPLMLLFSYLFYEINTRLICGKSRKQTEEPKENVTDD